MVDLVSVALLLEYEAVLTRVEFLRERGLAPAEVDAILDGLAAREGVSLNQLIATALAEKLSAQRTEDLPAERAARGDWDRVRAILDRVGTEPPHDGDELPPEG